MRFNNVQNIFVSFEESWGPTLGGPLLSLFRGLFSYPFLIPSPLTSPLTYGYWLCCAQSCLVLHDPMDCSPPGSSVHGIFQARTLEWVAISSSRGSSWPRDWICLRHWQAEALLVPAEIDKSCRKTSCHQSPCQLRSLTLSLSLSVDCWDAEETDVNMQSEQSTRWGKSRQRQSRAPAQSDSFESSVEGPSGFHSVTLLRTGVLRWSTVYLVTILEAAHTHNKQGDGIGCPMTRAWLDHFYKAGQANLVVKSQWEKP